MLNKRSKRHLRGSSYGKKNIATGTDIESGYKDVAYEAAMMLTYFINQSLHHVLDRFRKQS